MLDKAIHVIRTWDTTLFRGTGSTEKQYHYMFTVGGHPLTGIGGQGPFTETFGAGEHSTGTVADRLNKKAFELRELGIIPAEPEK